MTTSSGLLAGRRVLVTGVLTPKSIAFAIAQACQREGAEIVLTSFGRAMSLTERSARKLDPVPDVLELDATDVEQIRAVAAQLRERWGHLDAGVHAIAYAPEDCLGGNFLRTPWESVATAMQVSAFSMKSFCAELAPLMPGTGGAFMTLTFDGSRGWPIYDWMGPTKAALEATVRYLARDLGPQRIRVNALAAGPLETIAAKSIPGFNILKERWSEQAPLGWDSTDTGAIADVAAFLLSDHARAMTGEVVHVDGGYHAQGAPVLAAERKS